MTVLYAELIAQNTAAFKILELIHQVSCAIVDDYVALEDALTQALKGEPDAVDAIKAGLNQIRAGLDAAISAGEALADGILLNARVLMNVPETDAGLLAARLYDFLHANSKTFNDRDFVRGAFLANVGNTGNGTIYRFTVDAKAYNIQRGRPDVTTLTIVADSAGGKDGRSKTNAGQELFELRGRAAGQGLLDLELSGRGSGELDEIACLSSDDSLVGNASFGSFSGTTTTPTEITNWTPTTSIANFELDGTNFFRASVAEGTAPYSLKIDATDGLSQLLSVAGNSLETDAPYLCRIMYNRAVGIASGTLVLHLGAVSKSVAVAAQTGWNALAIDQDEDAWFENFGEDDATDVFIDWTSILGTLLVDDLIFAKALPWQGDGCFIAPSGGSTSWRLGDFGTITDTETGGVMARWWWRTKNLSLPTATGGFETEADPSITYA